jgi:hypothetical protein
MLRHAATQLADEFDRVYGTETIERFPHSSFEQFADHATVGKFLPLMAERFARQRVWALAKIEGLHDDGKPVVLFLCTHNAAAPKWPSDSFSDSPQTPRSPGPAAPNPASTSTRRRWRRWPNAASTSPPNSPSRGPTKRSAPPTW